MTRHADSCAAVLGGIFVGGRGSRMGGVAKGLLVAPDGDAIVLRTKRLFEELGIECVLVGAHPAYGHLGIEIIADDPSAEGPLAGIIALLERAGDRRAIAVACDMPFVGRDLLRRLVDAPAAAIVAPRRRDRERGRDVWEPLFCRYDPSMTSLARAFANEGGRKLQTLLDTVGATPLAMTSADEAMLEDWDTLPVGSARGSRGE